MSPDLSTIESDTRKVFDLPEAQPLETEEIIKGGSGRRFYRVSNPDQPWSVIAMHFTLERPENAHYEKDSEFLASQGVNVPTVLASIPQSQMLWITDLGKQDLWSLRDENWEKHRAPMYRSALDQAFKIHGIAVEDASSLPTLEPPFNETLYQWEQEYFFREFARRFSDCSHDVIESLGSSAEAQQVIKELSDLPLQLIHRDFQSQNIMIRDDDTWLIDYQGMRLGRPEYDLAALLYDPYVPITENQREELIDYYYSLKQAAGHTESMDTFRRCLYLCATQRLMQALGAYGFLGIYKGKSSFLSYIPIAVDRLRELVLNQETFPGLDRVLSIKE